MSTTPEQLQAEMNRWLGGSDGRTRHPFNRRFIYTEGVKAVADLAGAYWLLDIVATELAPICLRRWEEQEDHMALLTIKVKADSTCEMVLHDGNDDEVHWRRTLEFTDFPEGDWVFYMAIDGVIEQPKEEVVMLLPTEY